MINIAAENTGFNTLEILGFLEAKQQDILDQINTPANFIRKCVNPDGTVTEIKEDKKDDQN
jgi:hypothetical protein